MGSGEETEFLRCMFRKAMDVNIPSEIRRKANLCSRSRSVQYTTIYEGRWEEKREKMLPLHFGK